MIENDDPHYPILPGMELPHNIKVEVHKGELEHLKRLADTAITDFARLEEENAVLRKMLAAYQRESATGSMWISMEEREPTEEDGKVLLIWEDGMLDWGEYHKDVSNIVTHSDRCLDVQTGDEGHSIEWWMPLPPHPAKIDPPLAVPSKEPKKAYVVVLKMMDSWCLVGKKVFMRSEDANNFCKYAQNKAQKILDMEEVKLYDCYEPPKE
jgi:hypothetical protein